MGMKRPWKRPLPLSDVLKRALDKWKLTPQIQRHEVLADWEKVAGPQIATKSKPLKLQGDQLLVEVEHHGWVQELNLLKIPILEKIKSLYPKSKIKNIRFVLKS